MKKTFRILSILAALTSLGAPAFASELPIPQQEHVYPNILTNPGFENGKYGWTASGGATATANSTAKGLGSFGYDWDSNGAAQTLLSNSITIPTGYYGQNGQAYCRIKTPSGTATHTITVNDGSSDLVTAQQLVTSSTTHALIGVTFVFPTSGTIRLKLASVASNEPEIYIDDCYLGRNYQVAPVHQLGEWISYTPTYTAFGTVSASEMWYRRVGQNIELRGRFTAGTTTASEARMSLPDGLTISPTLAVATQVVGKANGNGSSTTSFSGKTVLASGGHTYVRFGTETSTQHGINAYNGNDIIGTGGIISLNASIPISGWATETAYRPELYAWRVDANISGANASLGTADVSTYTGITNASLTLANNTGNGVLTAQIPCSSTNSPTGTTCSVGDESIGVSFVLPSAGDVMACVQFSHLYDTNDEDGLFAFEIVETPSNAQTITQDGKEKVSFGFDQSLGDPPNDIITPVKVCSPFSFSSAGQKTLRLFYEQDVSSITASNILGDALATVGQRQIHWDVYPINQPMPAPLLVGSVTSNSTGLERIERAEINCDASSSITSQSGSWLSAIGNRSSASCAITIAAGIFSATPACTFTVKAATVQATSVSMSSATAGTVYGASADYDGYLMCMGSR